MTLSSVSGLLNRTDCYLLLLPSLFWQLHIVAFSSFHSDSYQLAPLQTKKWATYIEFSTYLAHWLYLLYCTIFCVSCKLLYNILCVDLYLLSNTFIEYIFNIILSLESIMLTRYRLRLMAKIGTCHFIWTRTFYNFCCCWFSK